jgi:hypothetical protein
MVYVYTNYMHKLIVSIRICCCNFIYLEFGHNHRPGYHQLDILVSFNINSILKFYKF